MRFDEWLHLCIAMATRSGGGCIQSTLEGFLDNGLQCNPCLGQPHELIPFLKGPRIEASGWEQMDGVGYRLPVCVGVAAQEGSFCAFLDQKRSSSTSAAEYGPRKTVSFILSMARVGRP